MNAGSPKSYVLGVVRKGTSNRSVLIRLLEVGSAKVEVDQEEAADSQLERETVERSIMVRGEGHLEGSTAPLWRRPTTQKRRC